MTMSAERIRPVRIEDEMRSSYLDYAMSVIVSRALPDVRDGLKPVHRRILYAMDEMGMRNDRPYKKSARLVGEVLGKYHPHGETAVYDSIVRMAQDFSMRYLLVDGQGNFGSMDNDPPAAMRYTEVRMGRITQELLGDIDRDTVDFVANFDGTLVEPTVLPTRLPNLLVNGSSGIAVGMATNIPPQNLSEVCDGIAYLLEHPDASAEDLTNIVKGPDFPTGGIILGREGIRQAYATGHGRIVVRAKTHVEETGRTGRYQIVVTELPYQVNKAAMVERMAEQVRDKKLDGISDLRDESDRQGLRVVIELRRDAQPRAVLNALFKHTAMQSAFSVNFLALVDGQPRVLGLKAALQHFIDFRRNVVRRRAEYDLKKAEARAHILAGLKVALDNMNAVVRLIREAADADAARTGLMTRFSLSQDQAQAILDMQLRRLASLERQRILDELAEILVTIADLQSILASAERRDSIVRDETAALKKEYGDARRTVISAEEASEFTDEDLMPHQEVVISLSKRGYIKRVAADTYRNQHRGGRGVNGAKAREEDLVHHLLVADTHDYLLIFTDRGRVFSTRCWDMPDGSRISKGIPIINVISIEQGESVTEILRVPDFEDGDYLIMATTLGEVKKTPLRDFASVRNSGIIAMDLETGHSLVSARLARKDEQLLLTTRHGKGIRFKEGDLRLASRSSGGVRGIALSDGDYVIAMDVVAPESELLTVSDTGYGKRTPVEQYRTQTRGGGGLISMQITDKTGPIAAARVVTPGQELILVSAAGVILRTSVSEISRYRRITQGVRVMHIGAKDRVVSLSCFPGSDRPILGGPQPLQLTLE